MPNMIHLFKNKMNEFQQTDGAILSILTLKFHSVIILLLPAETVCLFFLEEEFPPGAAWLLPVDWESIGMMKLNPPQTGDVVKS